MRLTAPRSNMGLTQTKEQGRGSAANPDDRPADSMPKRLPTRNVKLRALLTGVEASVSGPAGELEIRQVACDSRKVEAPALFFALHGAKADGNAFIRDAIARGAVAIASEEAAPASTPTGVTWIHVGDARKALAITAANFFGHPAKALQLVGVTGTNGKTTTTSLIDAMVKASGAKTGLFGTIAYHTPLREYPAPNTTPESVDLQGLLAEIRDAGGRYAILEASSHSLAMDRLWGCHFGAAVFTNLTREHMDYHKNFEDYFAAKRRAPAPAFRKSPFSIPTMNTESGLPDWPSAASPTASIPPPILPLRSFSSRFPVCRSRRRHPAARCRFLRHWSAASTSITFSQQ
jgi:UDP-N-acetylmuramyl tripeptide synthase